MNGKIIRGLSVEPFYWFVMLFLLWLPLVAASDSIIVGTLFLISLCVPYIGDALIALLTEPDKVLDFFFVRTYDWQETIRYVVPEKIYHVPLEEEEE